jgi:hypothetical protein
MSQTTASDAYYSSVSFGSSAPPDFDRAAEIAGAVRLDELGPAALRWFWPLRIPLGRVTLLAGDPGVGKSLLALDIAARASRGAPWPDESVESQESRVESPDYTSGSPLSALDSRPSSVLLLTAEDDLADTVLPRLAALGADPEKVVAIPAIPGQHVVEAPPSFFLPARDGRRPISSRPFELRRDFAQLELLLSAMPDCRLVIVDPISAYLGEVNDQANSEVRRMLLPLAALAHRYGVALLAVTHLRKKEGAAIYRAMGSLAFVAAARAAWLVAKDPRSAKRRLLLPMKNNLAPDVGGLAFTIESHAATNEPTIHWFPDPDAASVDSIVGNARPRGRPDHEREDAMDWLKSRLASGPAPAIDVLEEADAHGINKLTLRRAFRTLRGEAVKTGFGSIGQWQWRLPAASSPTSH